MYEYKAIVKRVYDGDTITVDIDLGFEHWMMNQTIRLYGIDTPELRGEERPEGLISADWLRAKILGKEIILRTHKDSKGKYGRWLGTIIYEGVNLNEKLIEEGLAEVY